MLRRLLLLLIFGALSGCSTVKLVYNQAGTIAAWTADDHFDFDSAQMDAFHVQFGRFHAWHRSTQLDRYASLLASVQRSLAAGLGTAETARLIDAIKAQIPALIDHGYAGAAAVLSTLSDQQVAAARRQFEKRNRKFASEHGVGAGADEQRRLRVKRDLQRIEHWTGALSPGQEARVAELSRALPLVGVLRQSERLRRQAEFLALLAARRDKAQFAARLRAWLLGWERTRTPEYARALASFLDARVRMYVQVHALLTPDQRHHVSDRLQGYIDAFRELAQESPRVAMETP